MGKLGKLQLHKSGKKLLRAGNQDFKLLRLLTARNQKLEIERIEVL